MARATFCALLWSVRMGRKSKRRNRTRQQRGDAHSPKTPDSRPATPPESLTSVLRGTGVRAPEGTISPLHPRQTNKQRRRDMNSCMSDLQTVTFSRRERRPRTRNIAFRHLRGDSTPRTLIARWKPDFSVDPKPSNNSRGSGLASTAETPASHPLRRPHL